jgi:hypothetical protein
MLRLISFIAHDIALRMAASPFMDIGINCSLTAAGKHSGTQEERRRVSSARHVQLSKNYLAYALYPVLSDYIARPMIMFNNFMW